MPAFTHHIFVCGNVRDAGHKRGCCDPEGRQSLREAFKKELKKAGFGALARANHAGCLEQCEHGPTVVIYPQGIWYGRVKAEDVSRIVNRTILGGEILNDLLIPDNCLNNPDCPHRRGPAGGNHVAELVESVEDLRREVAAAHDRGLRIGLVPTMGALHGGHLRLIEQCRALAGSVVVSIFVNPTQFGPHEDFERYPRPLDEDMALCRGAGTDFVFVPSAAAVYPHGPLSTFVEVPGLSDILEGASRPGHFRGVATVVLKLFEIVRPDLAVFGRKDYQQQLILRRMVEDLHLPVEIVTGATVREPDGLAISSRNRYLSTTERRAASVLYRALEQAKQTVAGGERNANRVRQILRQTIESEQFTRLDYGEVADADTLEPLEDLTPPRRAVALLAAWVGTTRLIDNRPLTE